ncbi:hypothetical protein BpHYR1_018348 [Brachionus plicatilis]|uniref:Uncharacterized protein n=1 Tax=Brachionus plicatilis TaxID=10195 RepID=A0A3M7RAT3_BRAPC|nr:hypothetical protein BpHYR1_018348 [Brachionus plicatilis]
MTSTANTSTSTGNPLHANHRNGQRTNCTPPFGALYRPNPYADITQGISQFCIMNQDTTQLDKHTNKFPEPYKKEVPSTDSLSTMARRMFSDSSSAARNPSQTRHSFNSIHKPKSITPPLPTSHPSNTKRPPSSTNFTQHSVKEPSPLKTNQKKSAPTSTTSTHSINYEIYDLEKIFDVRSPLSPCLFN